MSYDKQLYEAYGYSMDEGVGQPKKREMGSAHPKIEKFGDWLRYLMGELNTTQDELAAKTNANRMTIQHWVTGKAKPQAKMLGKLNALARKNNIPAFSGSWSDKQPPSVTSAMFNMALRLRSGH